MHFWDERYAGEEYAYGTTPNAFLKRRASLFFKTARVLAVGDGEGRNGAWLARLGLDVTSVDASQKGLDKAQRLARSFGTAIRTIHTDLTQWQWPHDEYDFIVSIFVHFHYDYRARIHRKMITALKPGGYIVMQCFTRKQLSYSSGGPKNPDMLYTVDMLRSDFAAVEIVTLDEQLTELDEGPFHQGQASVINFIARKPLD